jgi:hypothetical protein
MVTSKKDIWMAYGDEVADTYASGQAGAAYGMDEFATGELTAMDHPTGPFTMPFVPPKRTEHRAIGQDIADAQLWTAGKLFKRGQMSLFYSVSTWLRKAIGYETHFQKAVFGAIPSKTFALHYDSGEDEYQFFGCLIDDYTLHINAADDYVTQDIGFFCYDMDTTITAVTAVPFSTTRPHYPSEFTITLTDQGGALALEIMELHLNIKPMFDKNREQSSLNVKYPRLTDRKIEMDVTFRAYDAGLDLGVDADPYANWIDLSLVDGNATPNICTTVIDYLYVVPESFNRHEAPAWEEGNAFKTYSMKLRQANSSGVATTALT